MKVKKKEQKKEKVRKIKRFKGKLEGCVLSLLTSKVNICQDREASHWMMKSLFLDFKNKVLWGFAVDPRDIV